MQTQTHRHIDTHNDAQTHRRTDAQTHRRTLFLYLSLSHTHTHTHTHTHIHTRTHSHTHTHGHTHTHKHAHKTADTHQKSTRNTSTHMELQHKPQACLLLSALFCRSIRPSEQGAQKQPSHLQPAWLLFLCDHSSSPSSAP